MKVSSKTQYALATVMDLAQHRNTGVTKVTEIARRQNIPQKFLEQILLALKSGGIVGSKRGAKGGYLLLKDPKDIALSEIVRLTEEALLTLDNTSRTRSTPFKSVWQGINDYINATLDNVTIQDMCERADEMSAVVEYTI